MRMPLAPSMDVSSSSGLATAFCAASSARLAPRPTPVPIMAMPMPDMIVRTSAKSRLTMPGTRMRSEMPCTACCSTVSATLKASSSGVPRSTTESRRWLGIAMSVSTTARSASRPASAWSMRFLPSNVNGLVTTATVRMPRSRASDATMGAEPVPVPPPSPAVMKPMSAPSSRRVMASGSSSAALRPTSGLLPAPRPCVSLLPSCTLTGAGELRSACMSVLATMNSTPVNCAAIMRLTALPPPPPRPMTLIFAACGASSSSKSGRRARSRSIRPSSCARAPARRVHALPVPVVSVANSSGCSLPRDRSRLENFTQPTDEPPAPAAERGARRVRPRPRRSLPPRAVEREPHRGGVHGALHHVREAADVARHTAAHGLVEDRLRQLGHALHDRRAAGDDHAGRRRVLESRAAQLARDERENLLDARLDDLRQDLARELARLAPAHRRHVHRLLRGHERGERAAVALLERLRVGHRRAQADRHVVADVIAAQGQDRRVPHGAVAQEGEIGGAAADVDDDDAQLFFVGVE